LLNLLNFLVTQKTLTLIYFNMQEENYKNIV